MIVGERLKAIRETKNLSQGDIEKRTGLLRCYISRVENGHSIPSVETLEKMARAMEIALYQLFFEPDGHEEPQALDLPHKVKPAKFSRKDANVVSRLGDLVTRMDDRDKSLLIGVAQKLAAR